MALRIGGCFDLDIFGNLFFLKIYLLVISKHTVAVFRHTRRGYPSSLQMVVSHNVVARI